MTLRHWFTSLFKVLLEVVFPKKKHSAVVEKYGTSIIARQVEIRQYKGHSCLLPYNDDSVKHFLYAIKYEYHQESIAVAADILREHICDEIQEIEMVQQMRYALCTIPMTKERKVCNGYDHLHTILDVLRTRLPHSTPSIRDKRGLLAWRRQVARQSRLHHRLDRLKNVSGAMTITDTLFPNTIYFVIDDITTTGATLAEARRVLIANGAHTVITLALAH